MNHVALAWYQVQFEDCTGTWCNYPCLLANKLFGLAEEAEQFMQESREQSPTHAQWRWRYIATDIGGNPL